MSSSQDQFDSAALAQKDELNYVAVILHHVEAVFSVISVVYLFKYGYDDLAGVALAFLLLDRLSQFLTIGAQTSNWLKALLAFVFLDYLLDSMNKEEGRGMRLFRKKYLHVLLVSSSFAMFCFFGYFRGASESSSVLLITGLVHIINGAQSNMEFYTQNLLAITLKEKCYISALTFMECFFNLVFLSLLSRMLGQTGISMYLLFKFFVIFGVECFLCKKEGQDQSYWTGAAFLKGWTSIFYFRLEDVMIEDVDTWTETSKNEDNFRQQLKNDNNFKENRSKVFITLRGAENIILMIVGIAEFLKNTQPMVPVLIALAMIPLIILWHVQYVKFGSYSNSSNNQEKDKINNVPQTINTNSDLENQQLQFQTTESNQNEKQNNILNAATPANDNPNSGQIMNINNENGQLNQETSSKQTQPESPQNEIANKLILEHNPSRGHSISKSEQSESSTEKSQNMNNNFSSTNVNDQNDDEQQEQDANTFKIE